MMARLCREFGISRKTGYKLWSRYKDMGNEALIAQKRTPYRYANKLPLQMEALILDTKKEYPNWGSPKIREKISRRFPDIKLPAISTIHAVLDRNGLVESKLRRKTHTSIQPMHLSNPVLPNELWCADYKGEFMMGNRQYCYPLTITDHASRYLLSCEALTSTNGDFALETFTKVFKEFGLPRAIKTDNARLILKSTLRTIDLYIKSRKLFLSTRRFCFGTKLFSSTSSIKLLVASN